MLQCWLSPLRWSLDLQRRRPHPAPLAKPSREQAQSHELLPQRRPVPEQGRPGAALLGLEWKWVGALGEPVAAFAVPREGVL